MAHDCTPEETPFERQLTELFLTEFCPHGICCLCGNTGQLDTRGKVFSPAGKEVGAAVFCICPNGRVYKRLSEK